MHKTQSSNMDPSTYTNVVDRLKAKVLSLKAKVSSLEARMARMESSLANQQAQITRLQVANMSSCDSDSSADNVGDDAPTPISHCTGQPRSCMRQIHNNAHRHALVLQNVAERTSITDAQMIQQADAMAAMFGQMARVTLPPVPDVMRLTQEELDDNRRILWRADEEGL